MDWTENIFFQESGKKYKIPKKRGKYYTLDMISNDFCDLHEAYQFFRKKLVNMLLGFQAHFLFRFADLYGDQTLILAEEDMKKFNKWMDNWLEQRQEEWHVEDIRTSI